MGALGFSIASLNIHVPFSPSLGKLHFPRPPQWPGLSLAGSTVSAFSGSLLSYSIAAFLRPENWFCSYLVTCPLPPFLSFCSFIFYLFLFSSSTSFSTCILSDICWMSPQELLGFNQDFTKSHLHWVQSRHQWVQKSALREPLGPIPPVFLTSLYFAIALIITDINTSTNTYYFLNT